MNKYLLYMPLYGNCYRLTSADGSAEWISTVTDCCSWGDCYRDNYWFDLCTSGTIITLYIIVPAVAAVYCRYGLVAKASVQ